MIGLLVVFVLAKASVLWGRTIEWSAWAILAYIWQDVLVAGVVGAVSWAALTNNSHTRIPSLLYWLLVGYVALNIPIVNVLSTPLTWPMLRATSSTLADSILLYVTWHSVLMVVVVLGAAALVPRLIGRVATVPVVVVMLSIVALGPIATTHVDTLGLHRNPVIALAASALPRVTASAASADWTVPPFDARSGDDLTHLRGIAAGRNVILVSLESTGAQYLRLYGGTYDVTPNLDRLARTGVVFDTAYAVYPESIKGLLSILCSMYPAFDTAPEIYERSPCQSLAQVLSEAGYSTALFHSGRFGYLGMNSMIQRRGYHVLEDAGDIGGKHESSFGVDERATVTRILSWIDALPTERKFFVTYLPIAGHHPYESPEPGPFPSRDELGRYRNALHYGDQSLGALMAGIRSRGLEQKTLWMVLGDHGEALGQHEGNYGHTFFLYEENVRVPFLVAAPGLFDGEHRSGTTVSLVDTAPTLLDLLGFSIPAEHQGRSALDGSARMALFFTDYSLGLVGLRDGRWKYIHELDSRRSKLFDLGRDVAETSDVSRAHPARVMAYEKALRAWSAAQKGYVRRVTTP